MIMEGSSEQRLEMNEEVFKQGDGKKHNSNTNPLTHPHEITHKT